MVRSSEISQKAQAIAAKAQALQEDDVAARMCLLKDVKSLYGDLEPPMNTLFSQWISLTVFTCLNVAVKLGIMGRLSAERSISAEELAGLVSVEASVIVRVMRVLVAEGIVASPATNVYLHTPKSLLYVRGERTMVDSFELLTLLDVSFITLPEYLNSRPARDLTDPTKSPYACAYGMEGKTFYEVMSANQTHLDIFNRAMAEPGPNHGAFPFSSLKEDVEAEPDRPFVVDIGGGKGQALVWIRDATQMAFGSGSKLILQDRPDVLEQISPGAIEGIEPMPYDFHTAQPVKGAHVYYLCQILHNYSDETCKDILDRVAGAMRPDSRLLIVDAVLPQEVEAGGEMVGYLIDIVGLVMGGRERTEAELAALLDGSGLELVKVWKDVASYQAIAEARVKRA